MQENLILEASSYRKCFLKQILLIFDSIAINVPTTSDSHEKCTFVSFSLGSLSQGEDGIRLSHMDPFQKLIGVRGGASF